MRFCYILTKQEKSMYDDKVVEDVLFNKNFIIPEKKCQLAKFGYYDINYLLCLYCVIKYYLKEKTMAN